MRPPATATGIPVGALVWFDNEPYGDVGVSVGNSLMLAVTDDGWLVIAGIGTWHAPVHGWSLTIGDAP
jgi:hypothetical protein